MIDSRVGTFLWLSLAAVSGAGGFYFGFGYGAKTLGALATQNKVSESLGRVRTSLTEIEKSNIEYSLVRRRSELRFALFELGATFGNLAYWECSDRDRSTIQAAAKYFLSHPEDREPNKELALIMAPHVEKALQFCQHQSLYRQDGL